MMAELEHLAPRDRVRLAGACVTGFEEGRQHATTVLELLPPCLSLILPGVGVGGAGDESGGMGAGGDEGDGASQADGVDGGAGGGGGSALLGAPGAHRDAALHRLLHADWRPEQVGALLAVLRDAAPTPQQAQAAIAKAVRCARGAELQLLPPILYQALLLSAAGPRAFALARIAALFEELAARGNGAANANGSANGNGAASSGRGGGAGPGPGSVLLQVQGTVLMHASTLLKYDAALGAEWLKGLRAKGPGASPFALQVALTMAGVPRLEAPTLALLKRGVLAAYAAERAGSGCAWLDAAAAGGGAGGGGGGTPTATSRLSAAALESALLQAVR